MEPIYMFMFLKYSRHNANQIKQVLAIVTIYPFIFYNNYKLSCYF